MRKITVSREDAALIALKALVYLTQEHGRLQRFLALTGLEVDAIAEMATGVEFQAAVLGHLMTDESSLLEFCESEDIDPELPAVALRLLEADEEGQA